jgi:hypothetical protein
MLNKPAFCLTAQSGMPMPSPPRVARTLLCVIVIMAFFINGNAQIDSAQEKLTRSFSSISNKSLQLIDNRYSLLQKIVETKTEKMLRRMQKKEMGLQQEMQGKDSVKAKQLFASSEAKYQQLAAQLRQPIPANSISSYNQYLPALDSLKTSLQFLSQRGANVPGVPADKLQKIQLITQQLSQLQGKMQVAGEAQVYVSQRAQQLKQQLISYGLGNKLLGLNKEAFYYQQELTQFKSIINDKEKMEETALAAIRQVPEFQSFWQKYSILGQLFPMPSGLGSAQALNGLQTKLATQTLLKSVGGSVGPDPQYVQQQVQQAQSTLNTLKDKVSAFGGTSGSGDMTTPDFTLDSQHGKRLTKRLEFGFNIQNSGATNLIPSISNIALTVGYKLSDKATVGVGASYLMGWGTGITHVELSNQGLGGRSYIDIKAKGSIWVTGGLEYTYYQAFVKLSDIKDLSIWQRNVLIGLTKKTTIGKSTANIQLLYNFLYKQEVPQGQPFLFRVGYTL